MRMVNDFVDSICSLIGWLVSIDWLGAVVIGWFLGLVSRPIGHLIDIWWFGPRLVLAVESNPYEFDFNTYKEVYVNVAVTNDKRRTAEDCRAWLVNIEKWSDGDFQPTPYRDSLPLIWAYDPSAQSVPVANGKGLVRRVNVVTIRDDCSGYTPRLRRHNGELLQPEQYASIFSENGKFRFTVLVTGQDTTTNPVQLCVERNDGEWPPKVTSWD